MARGFAQRPRIDFFETFALVARLDSLLTLPALAAKFDLKISQLDIETAYLSGKMDTTVSIEPPELLGNMLDSMATSEIDPHLRGRSKALLLTLASRKSVVCKLLKALYGLRQAGRQ